MSDFNSLDTLPEPLKGLWTESTLKGRKRQERYPHHRFFGIWCSYFPEEIVLAAGLEPLRLFPAHSGTTPAELPPFCCSLARGILDMAVRGEFNDLVGVGFAHTCDTMQGLSGIWVESLQIPTVNLVPPVTLTNQGAARYYQAELRDGWQKLQELSGRKATGTDLLKALELCRSYRRLAAEIDELRPMLPSALTAAILRAGQLMPRSQYVAALGEILPMLRQMAAPDEARARVLLSGAVLENDSLYSLLEQLGGRVVADDTCTGFRHYADNFSDSDEQRVSAPDSHSELELFAQVVERYVRMPSCPCKHKSLDERLNYLTALASGRAAEGIIFVIRKYCDPHAWDAVYLSQKMQEQGLKTLVLELEGADAGGQERTRLQAFLESIVADRRSMGGKSYE